MEKQKINNQDSIELVQDEIDKISSSFSTLEYDDFDNLKEEKKKSTTNKIILAKLFLSAYDRLKEMVNLVKSEEVVENKILPYLKSFECKEFQVENLRDLLEEYKDGERFGDYYTGEKIRDIVAKNRDKINNLINLFFKIFGEENI